MDMQGTPIGSSAQGMKNTSDPAASTNPKTEGSGAIASDSLAAESARSGGAFASNPTSESTSSDNPANTDISNATKLGPAPNSQARENVEARDEQEGAAVEGGSGTETGGGGSNQVKGRDEAPFGTTDTDTSSHGVSGAQAAQATGLPGSGSGGNNSNNSNDNGNNNPSDKSPGNQGGDSGSDVAKAPTYIPTTHSQPHQSSGKPHGKNITEDENLDSSNTDDGKKMPNASFTAEIGSEDDPSRKAVGDFQKMAQSASGGTGPRQGPEEGKGQGGFEALGEE